MSTDKDCMRVVVEFLPNANANQSRTLCQMKFWNVGKNENGGFDYKFEVSRWAPNMSKLWKSGIVKAFDRDTRGPWDLVYCALADVAGNRNVNAPLPQTHLDLRL